MCQTTRSWDAVYRVSRHSEQTDTGLPRFERAISLIPCPVLCSLQPQQRGCWFFASYQDLSIFKESQKDDPGDPWLQAEDNITMEPNFICLEPPTVGMLPPPEQLLKVGIKAGPSPHMAPFCHLIVNDVNRLWAEQLSQKVWMTHHGASVFLSNLALVILAHSLPAMDVSPGNQSPGMAWLNEQGCAWLLILKNNHWPRLLDQLLLQPKWEYKGTKKVLQTHMSAGFHIRVSHRYKVIN